jgi:hypothetical protein
MVPEASTEATENTDLFVGWVTGWIQQDACKATVMPIAGGMVDI